MSADTHLPAAKDVRDLLADLLARDVEVTTGGAMVDPDAGFGALLGVYVDQSAQLGALVLLDIELAARMGAAIALLPPRAAETAIANGLLPDNIRDNAAEILNIMASLFNVEGAPHVRLDVVYAPGDPVPASVAQWVPMYGRRCDLDMDVAGYGPGKFSLIVP
jgi:hypothetical protein